METLVIETIDQTELTGEPTIATLQPEQHTTHDVELIELQTQIGRMPSCPIYTMFDISKGKRICKNCRTTISRGERCVSWFEYSKPYARTRFGKWIKCSLCLDCSAEYLLNELNKTRKLLRGVQYRRRHAKKVKELLNN